MDNSAAPPFLLTNAPSCHISCCHAWITYCQGKYENTNRPFVEQYLMSLKLFGSCDGQKMLESETLQIPWPDQLESLPYLIFVIFLHSQIFWRIKFTPKNVGKSNVADSLARSAEVPACNKVCKIASKACVYSQFSGSWASLETGNMLDLILPPTLTQTFTANISQFPMLTKCLDHQRLLDHQTQ